MILHENCLPADISHEVLYLICYFCKSSKIWNGRLLQIIGGALRDNSQLTFEITTVLSLYNTMLGFIVMDHVMSESIPWSFSYISFVKFHGRNIWEPQHTCYIKICVIIGDCTVHVVISKVILQGTGKPALSIVSPEPSLLAQTKYESDYLDKNK